MKKNLLLGSIVLTLFSISVLIFQFSCSQQAPAQISGTNCIGPQPKFQFKANGVLYVCDALYDSRVGWYGNLFGQLQEGGGNLPRIINGDTIILSGALKTTSSNSTYTYIGLFIPNATLLSTGAIYTSTNVYTDCNFSFSYGNGYMYNKSNHTVTFTRVSNGTADGTFSGAVWPTSAPSQVVTITDGVFSNLPVL